MTHLFTDADNTLWDTNTVYATAQVGLVRDVGVAVDRPVPPSDTDALALLRGIDQRIAAGHPDGLRYPSALLEAALRLVLAGVPRDDAVTDALAGARAPVRDEAILSRFAERLRAVPALRAGVRKGLQAASGAGIPITVLTEERPERCRSLLKTHDLLNLVKEIVPLRKTTAAYLAIRESLPGERLLMVGDQVDRDIAAARGAGFETFLFPGGFTPYWNAEASSGADHDITRYDEIVKFLDIVSAAGSHPA